MKGGRASGLAGARRHFPAARRAISVESSRPTPGVAHCLKASDVTRTFGPYLLLAAWPGVGDTAVRAEGCSPRLVTWNGPVQSVPSTGRHRASGGLEPACI